MVSFIFALILLGLGLLGICLRRIYYYLPAKELKRQAESGDRLAAALWRAVAYESSLRILLWLWIGLTIAGGFVLLAKLAPWPIAFIGIVFLVWIAFAWFPRRTKLTTFEARLSVWLTPAVVWLLNYLHPVLDHTLAVLLRRHPHDTHTSLYEADDLLELVERQKGQPDNRIDAAHLDAVQRVLSSHRYKVSDLLTPRAQVKTVSDADTIGLVLLDELHATGQSSFPVQKGKTDKIVGTLYLRDLGLKTEGKVRDYMQSDVRYVHEDDSLSQALQAFFKTKHQLFVVVNSFEEYVGVITLESIVGQLTGNMQADDFDQHNDLAAVANKHAHDDDEPEPELEEEEVTVPEAEPATEAVEPEPEVELVTDEPLEEPAPEMEEEPELEIVSVDDEPVDLKEESTANLDTDSLAALDLPDEEESFGEGAHITFEKPKNDKSKQGAKKSTDEVVE